MQRYRGSNASVAPSRMDARVLFEIDAFPSAVLAPPDRTYPILSTKRATGDMTKFGVARRQSTFLLEEPLSVVQRCGASKGTF